MSKNQKEDLSKGLESTLGLLKLPQSELKKAQAVIAGQNRQDLIIGAESASTPVAPREAELPATPETEPTPPASVSLRPAVAPRARGAASKRPKLMRAEVPLRHDQIELLMDIEFKLRTRKVRGGRLTRASVIRALLDVLPHLQVNYGAISDEDSLRDHILEFLELPTPSKGTAKPSGNA